MAIIDTNWPPVVSSRNSRDLIAEVMKRSPYKLSYSLNDNNRAGTGNDYHTYSMARDFYRPDWQTTAGAAAQRDLAKWFYDKYPQYITELIHTTPFDTDNGFYIKNGRKVGPGFYGASVENAHKDHVHIAITKEAAQKILSTLPSTPTPSPGGGSTMAIDVAYLLEKGLRGPGNLGQTQNGVPINWLVRKLGELQAENSVLKTLLITHKTTLDNLSTRVAVLESMPTAQLYTVVGGDTLYGIAQKFPSLGPDPEARLAKLIQLNPQVTNPDVLQIGQKLKVS